MDIFAVVSINVKYTRSNHLLEKVDFGCQKFTNTKFSIKILYIIIIFAIIRFLENKKIVLSEEFLCTVSRMEEYICLYE